MSESVVVLGDVPSLSAYPTEAAVSFGEHSQLVGVYTPAMQASECELCAIYITAGLLHHIGPTRLHVELSRDLSNHNVAGLRFDLSGIGDSETSSLGGYFTERSVAEVRSAMDFLQQRFEHKRFILIGLCSGADDALATAQVDSRVQGVVLLNGYAYPSPAGKFKLYRFKEFYLPRLFMLHKWVNKLKRLVAGGNKTSNLTDAAAVNPELVDASEKAAIQALDDDYRYIPPMAETGKIIQALSAAGVQLFFVYNGSEHDTYTYQGQLKDMFPELVGNDRVKEAYLKEADHTFIVKTDRDKLSTWLQEWFAEATFARRA